MNLGKIECFLGLQAKMCEQMKKLHWAKIEYVSKNFMDQDF